MAIKENNGYEEIERFARGLYNTKKAYNEGKIGESQMSRVSSFYERVFKEIPYGFVTRGRVISVLDDMWKEDKKESRGIEGKVL